MSIDINKIAQEKITEMEESGKIKTHLEEKLQALILESVGSALGSWEMQRKIKDKIEKQISPCLDTLDFTAYNSFICEKIKQITTQYLEEDIRKKVSKTFEGIFMLKREKIKLSEIFYAYREFLINNLEDAEKYELGNDFYFSVNDNDYHFIEYSLSKEKPTHSYLGSTKDLYLCDCGFTVCKSYNEPKSGRISSVYFDGGSVKDVLKVASYNSFQSLLLNLYYNETPIEFDVEEDYIQTDLGLDI